MTKLRILLAEDHKVMREGLRMVVNKETNMNVVGEVDNGAAVVRLAQELQPDVVVMDISMPELNGLKATEALKTLVPNVKILILTRHTDRSYVQQLLRSGASGYVLKQSAPDELVRAIARVAAGQRYLDPAITEQVMDIVSADAGMCRSPARPLSGREEEVLRFVALGFLSREIAALLHISIKTIETHKANAMSKMGMKNRIDIVRYAVLQGWLQDT
jgi:DNA-binding NarL/FixJ family response regulator